MNQLVCIDIGCNHQAKKKRELVRKKIYNISVQYKDDKNDSQKNLGNKIGAINNSVHYHYGINTMVRTLH